MHRQIWLASLTRLEAEREKQEADLHQVLIKAEQCELNSASHELATIATQSQKLKQTVSQALADLRVSSPSSPSPTGRLDQLQQLLDKQYLALQSQYIALRDDVGLATLAANATFRDSTAYQHTVKACKRAIAECLDMYTRGQLQYDLEVSCLAASLNASCQL